MKRFRKWEKLLAGVIMLVMLFCMVGCAGNTQTPSNSPSENPKETVTWRFAIQGSDKTTMGILAHQLSEEVAKRTNGGFKIEVFTGGVLGKNTAVLESVQAGLIEMTQVASGGISNFVPEIGFWSLPYLVTDWDHANALMASDIFDPYDEILLNKGFYPLALYFGGFRHCLNNTRPITCLEDFAGIKIRTLESSIYIDTFTALGAYPISLAASEVNTGLQQNTIDGYENPLDNIIGDGAYEFLDYLTLTGHMSQAGYYVANPDAMKKLPEEYRNVLLEVSKEVAQEFIKLAQEGETVWVQQMVDSGIERTDLSDEAKQELVDFCRSEIWPKYEDKYGDIMKAVSSYVP